MKNIDKLKWLNKRRKLALFVGAGVSSSCGLPGWNSLISDLAYRVWGLERVDNFLEGNNLRIARALREDYRENFEELVEKILYSYQINYSDLILSIPDSGINRICSFNFDNLLESAFQICGVKHDVALPGTKYNQHNLKPIVFHPHGYLAYSNERTEIVFSEQEYHNLYSDPYCWSNLVQLNLLMNYSVLFVGISLTDPNLRRLIDSAGRITNHSHFAIFKEKQSTIYSSSLSKDLSSLGIIPVWVKDYGEIASIFQKIQRTEESKKQRKIRLSNNIRHINQHKKNKRIKRMLNKLQLTKV